MKHIFFLVLTGLAFSCGKGSNVPKKQTISCYVRYLAENGQTRAEATLYEGTTASMVPVEAKGGVRYQGVLMSILPVQGITYRIDQSRGFMLQHKFSWKDEEGIIREFDLDAAQISGFTFGRKTLSRSAPATLSWAGAPLEAGETLVLLWENARLNKTLPMEITSTREQASIDFPATKLAELAPGNWTLYLVRKRITRAKIEGWQANGMVEYFTTTDSLTIE